MLKIYHLMGLFTSVLYLFSLDYTSLLFQLNFNKTTDKKHRAVWCHCSTIWIWHYANGGLRRRLDQLPCSHSCYLRVSDCHHLYFVKLCMWDCIHFPGSSLSAPSGGRSHHMPRCRLRLRPTPMFLTSHLRWHLNPSVPRPTWVQPLATTRQPPQCWQEGVAQVMWDASQQRTEQEDVLKV